MKAKKQELEASLGKIIFDEFLLDRINNIAHENSIHLAPSSSRYEYDSIEEMLSHAASGERIVDFSLHGESDGIYVWLSARGTHSSLSVTTPADDQTRVAVANLIFEKIKNELEPVATEAYKSFAHPLKLLFTVGIIVVLFIAAYDQLYLGTESIPTAAYWLVPTWVYVGLNLINFCLTELRYRAISNVPALVLSSQRNSGFFQRNRDIIIIQGGMLIATALISVIVALI